MKNFKELNSEKWILVLANVWDINSAIIFEKKWYKAIWTSSGAIANSLWYEDWEEMNFEELFTIIKSIKNKTNIPLNVDLEWGYSRNIFEICKNIKKLADIWVTWINLEDSIVKNNERQILDTEKFCLMIIDIKEYIKEKRLDIFLNIRTDSFIMWLEKPLQNSLERIKEYEKAWADWIFIPCVVEDSDIKELTESTKLPINIMTMPWLSDFKTLEKLWVKRISMWPFIFNKINDTFEKTINEIEKEQSFRSLFR